MHTQKPGCSDVQRVSVWAGTNVSCGWDDTPNHPRGFDQGTQLWHLRWRFIARACRIGYNILSLDRWARHIGATAGCVALSAAQQQGTCKWVVFGAMRW